MTSTENARRARTGAGILKAGERFEYQVAVDDQSRMIVYGGRHDPFPEGAKVWLRLRADGHSAWPLDQSTRETTEQ